MGRPRHPRTLHRLLAAGLAAALLLATPVGAEGFGPAPRDDEGRFLNLSGPLERAGPSVTLPFFLRRIGTSLTGRDGFPARVPNDGAFLRVVNVPRRQIGTATLTALQRVANQRI